MMKNDSYEIIVTGDGSRSLFSKNFSELMHTKDGAYEESVVKHVIPSGILNHTKDKISVLDVGFGVGYNILGLLVLAGEQQFKGHINVTSLEIDRSISEWLEDIRFNDGRDIIFSTIKQAFNTGSYSNDRYSIEVVFGDARKSILAAGKNKQRYDAVFQDAFSPGKNPELWSLDYFKVIYDLMNTDGILTTYSAAPQIRRAMVEAGFYISSAQSTGAKKEGTLASKSAEILSEIFGEDSIHNLFSDVKSTVYRDENLSSAREVILSRRIDEMKSIRENRQVHQE